MKFLSLYYSSLLVFTPCKHLQRDQVNDIITSFSDFSYVYSQIVKLNKTKGKSNLVMPLNLHFYEILFIDK